MIHKPSLTKISLIGGICFIFVLILLGMSSSEAGIQSSGGKNQACGPSCHTDAEGVITISVQNWPGTYSLDTQYTVTVSVTDSILSTGMGGVWISTGSVGTLGIGTDQHLEVKNNDLIQSDAGATSWTFTWDSPVTNSGTVTLIVYAMVINDASGKSGDSWDSVTHDSLPPPDPPSAPQSLTATPGDSQVSLNWVIPASDGGSAITQYNVYLATTSGGSYTNIANPTGLSYIDNTVTNGITYYYNVTAVNVAGESPSSNEASAIPSTVPSAPQSLTATSGDTQVSLSWTVPISDGGSAITQYNVYRATTSGGTYTNIANPTGLSYIDNTVTNGITYYYNVTAVNAAGESPSSNEASVTPIAPPSAPQTLEALYANDNIILNWTAPISDGGSAITKYRIYRDTTIGLPDGINIANVTSGEQSYVDTQVSTGIRYYYVVTAVNNEGESPVSNEIAITSGDVPSVPRNINSPYSNNQIILNWSVPITQGGSAITHYQVYRATTSGGSYTNIANTTELSYLDNTVTNGITYYYVITAVNDEGESGYSTEMSATLTTSTSIQSSSTTTTTTDSISIGLLGFFIGIVVMNSVRWFKKHEKR